MTAYLLDTNIALYTLLAPSKIPPHVRTLLQPLGVDVFVSAASWYEVALKTQLGRLSLPIGYDLDDLCRILPARCLAISSHHADRAGKLPLTNRDPFDRLIVAQALEEGLVLVSSDSHLDGLGIQRLW